MKTSELKKRALEHLKGKWGTIVAMTVFRLSFIMVFVLAEILIYLIFQSLGIEYSFRPSFIFGTGTGRFMLAARIILILIMFMPEKYVLRRLMLDIYEGRNFIETRKFIQFNSRKIHPKAVAGFVVPTMLKIFAAIPLVVSLYGICRFGFMHRDSEITTFSLFIFMLSIGFSLVWAGVLIHYFISLAMTKYIVALNPRANIFDACDLSVRMMEGNHMRYVLLLLSFVKYLPLLVLFYPYFILAPYFRMSFMVFAEDVMGSYWQDKYPAMIKRWNKYAG